MSMRRRQGDAERRAPSWRALHADVSRMLLDDSVRDSETKPGASTDSFGCVERVVKFRDILRSDADAGVPHLNHKLIFFRGDGGNRDTYDVSDSIRLDKQQDWR